MQCIGQSHYFKARLEAHIKSPTFSCELKLPMDREDRKVRLYPVRGILCQPPDHDANSLLGWS